MYILKNGQQARVLVIDDNAMGRQMLRAMLENIGIQVSEAKNGLEAVERVKAEEFDLLLMDIQMPTMDGRSATLEIRALGKDNLPIIAMTAAYSLDEFRTESLSAGMNGHLAKPIEFETLAAELQCWLPAEKQPLVSKASAVDSGEYSGLEAALPGIDVKGGIRRVVGRQSLYLELLRKFTERFSVTEIELRKELATGRQKKAILRVHTLKGVAAGLGAKQLQNLAGELEEQLTQWKSPTALPAMGLELDRLLTAIKALPEMNRPEVVRDELIGTATELRNIFIQLLEPLKNLQAHTVKQHLSRIKEKDWPKEYTDNLLQLEKLIEQYQFNPAVKLVESLLEVSEG